MPRGVKNTENKDTEPATRTTRPRMSDEQKAIQEVEKLRPRVATTEEKLKKARKLAAELDEQLKKEQGLLTWALANPFLPDEYKEQADVSTEDAGELTPVEGEVLTGPIDASSGDELTAVSDAVTEDGDLSDAVEVDIPGADVVEEAAEDRIEQSEDNSEDNSDDPFANFDQR